MLKYILMGSVVWLTSLTGVSADQGHTHKMAACDLGVKLSMEAEMQDGGANFKGEAGSAMAGMAMTDTKKMAEKMSDKMEPAKKMTGMKEGSHKMAGMKAAAHDMKPVAHKMPGMQDGKMGMSKGAHTVHEGSYGGTFFMAPNKTHHIEALYSKECGFNLVIYNAMTQPIDVSRFKAFVKFIPEDEDQFESYRILTASQDRSVLQAAKGPNIQGPFEMELYIAFPGRDEPDMFNIANSKMAHHK